MNIVEKIFKHIKLVSKHKLVVFKLACKVGIPWRGFMHDWSKFSPEEFFESVKYYNGKKSPIIVCKQKNGYSKAKSAKNNFNLNKRLSAKTEFIPFLII